MPNRMKRFPPLILIVALPIVAGCTGARSGTLWQMPQWKKPKGERWTIQCVNVRGPDRIARTESLADDLRRTANLQAKKVRVVHGRESSKVLYGTYYRLIDRDTGQLLRPPELNRDLLLIQQGRFIGARAVSAPETDIGDPALNLDAAKGTYTLLIAVFENTADFYERKQAAAEYAKELRRRGYEAYYRHGPRTSEVTVGTFGPDAIIERDRTSVQYERSAAPTPYVSAKTRITDYSMEVKRLQAKENFRYQLVNLNPVSISIKGQRQHLSSQLVRIHPEAVEW